MLKMASQAAMLWCSGNPKRERYLTSDPQKISKEPLPVGLRKIRFQPDIAIQSIRSLCQRMVRGATPTLLLPKQKMTLAEKIFYAKAISLNRSKFSYGRKPKGERLKSIKLPDHPPA